MIRLQPMIVGVFNFMEKEIWKDIPNYEGHYQVSNFGNVKSFKYKQERILSKGIVHGYYYVILSLDKKLKPMRVHKLVAMAFLNHKPCGMKLVVNHINFDKTDNRVENLEVVTQRENANQKHLKSTSDYTGVWRKKKSNKFESRIVINGKQKYVGLFNNEKEAHIAYLKELNNI